MRTSPTNGSGRSWGSNSETDIAGATGSSYAVTSDDAGKAIKVRVAFTDDAGNEESLTSFGVIAAPALPEAPGAGTRPAGRTCLPK